MGGVMIMTRTNARTLIVAVLLGGFAVPARGVDDTKGFTGWLNERINKRVAIALSTRSNSNQAEAPSASTNASTLLDMSSASDLIGLALNASGLTKGSASDSDEEDATSGAVTVSGYALYSAGVGQDPLAPGPTAGPPPESASCVGSRLRSDSTTTTSSGKMAKVSRRARSSQA
jgi:hypothetical protein